MISKDPKLGNKNTHKYLWINNTRSSKKFKNYRYGIVSTYNIHIYLYLYITYMKNNILIYCKAVLHPHTFVSCGPCMLIAY